VLTRLLLRLLFIQALWNYRTMLGAGLAWALLPALRRMHDGDPEALRDALSRQGEHFNAHPYLVGFAAGAMVRMEDEEEPSETIRRFRHVIRTPLGGLGDSLVWTGWLPLCVLGAGALGLVLQSPFVAVLAFLLVYNVGHLLLRWWSLRMGLELGRGLGEALRRARFPEMAERVGRGGVFFVGLLAGFALAAGYTGPDPVFSLPGAGLVVVLGGALLALGWLWSRRSWWWTLAAVVGGVFALLVVGHPGG
jgi:mannose PTS system EIID component